MASEHDVHLEDGRFPCLQIPSKEEKIENNPKLRTKHKPLEGTLHSRNLPAQCKVSRHPEYWSRDLHVCRCVWSFYHRTSSGNKAAPFLAEPEPAGVSFILVKDWDGRMTDVQILKVWIKTSTSLAKLSPILSTMMEKQNRVMVSCALPVLTQADLHWLLTAALSSSSPR